MDKGEESLLNCMRRRESGHLKATKRCCSSYQWSLQQPDQDGPKSELSLSQVFFFPFGIKNQKSFAKGRAVAEAEIASHKSAHWQLPASVFLRNQDVFSCGCQGLVTKQQAVSSIAEIHRGRILTAWWSLTNSWPPNEFIRLLVGVWIRGLLTDA